LADATETIEQYTQLQNTAMKTIKDQIAATPGSALVGDALGSLARVNPFWAKPASKEAD
jgi:hypothetical protein